MMPYSLNPECLNGHTLQGCHSVGECPRCIRKLKGDNYPRCNKKLKEINKEIKAN
jgi:hypothetical protein